MTMCYIESKKVGENILSNLDMIICIFSFILTTSFVLNVLEYKSLKDRLNLVRAFHTNYNNDLKANGSKDSLKT